MTHFFHQGHTYSNKGTPPNSAAPYGLSIQTHESMGAIPIQTTTAAFWVEYTACANTEWLSALGKTVEVKHLINFSPLFWFPF